MKEDDIGRRSFFKYLLTLGVFGIASILGFKKEEGFYIGKMRGFQMGTPEASGECGSSGNCAGGGGQCGSSGNCAGGGGQCGSSGSCAGGRD